MTIKPTSLAIALVLASSPLAAQSNLDPARFAQCHKHPLFDFYRTDLGKADDRATAKGMAHAQQFNVLNEQTYVLEGDAEVQRADQWVAAETIHIDHEAQTFEAQGDVRYQDADLIMSAQQVKGNQADKRSQIDDATYQLISARGNGVAKQIAVHDQTTNLTDVTYSTCDPDARAWYLDAGEMSLDQAENEGVARDVTLRVGDVPLLYLPYFSFPLNNKAKTGFLYPSIGYSDRNGLDVTLPWYWRISDQMDATLYPRILGERGLMLGTEFRYLTNQHRGELYVEHLPHDRKADRHRGSFSFQHDGRLSKNWMVRANINRVSDERYFIDFGRSLNISSTALLDSNAGLYGRGQHWQAAVQAQAWQWVDPLLPNRLEPYRHLPRATFAYDRFISGPLRVGLRTEAIWFDHTSKPDASRFDVQPEIALDWRQPWGFVKPALAYRSTWYRLDDGFGLPGKEPNRNLPIMSLDAGLMFERNTQWGDTAMRQTLEPRLFYLNVPHRDQSNMPIFDTRPFTLTFPQLFATNRFSGADRQMDANQATVAVTSRWSETATGQERLALSLGQIRYFSDQRVGMPNEVLYQRNASALVADAQWQINDQWRLASSVIYDPEKDELDVASFGAQHLFGDGGVANFAYRYRRELIDQIDTSVSYPIDETWRVVGRVNHSFRDDSLLEAFAGLQWEGCCMAVRVLGRHYLSDRNGQKDNAIFVELELKGLGSFGRSAEDLLQNGILGYQTDRWQR